MIKKKGKLKIISKGTTKRVEYHTADGNVYRYTRLHRTKRMKKFNNNFVDIFRCTGYKRTKCNAHVYLEHVENVVKPKVHFISHHSCPNSSQKGSSKDFQNTDDLNIEVLTIVDDQQHVQNFKVGLTKKLDNDVDMDRFNGMNMMNQNILEQTQRIGGKRRRLPEQDLALHYQRQYYNQNPNFDSITKMINEEPQISSPFVSMSPKFYNSGGGSGGSGIVEKKKIIQNSYDPQKIPQLILQFHYKNFLKLITNFNQITVHGCYPNYGFSHGHESVEIFLTLSNSHNYDLPRILQPHLSKIQVYFGRISVPNIIGIKSVRNYPMNAFKNDNFRNWSNCSKSQIVIIVKNPPHDVGHVDVSIGITLEPYYRSGILRGGFKYVLGKTKKAKNVISGPFVTNNSPPNLYNNGLYGLNRSPDILSDERMYNEANDVGGKGDDEIEINSPNKKSGDYVGVGGISPLTPISPLFDPTNF